MNRNLRRYRALPESFVPSPEQSAWARGLIRVITDGGYWKVPATGQIYKLDKGAKTLTLVRAVNSALALQWHAKNKVMFGSIGYQVLDDPASSPDEKSFAEALVDRLLGA